MNIRQPISYIFIPIIIFLVIWISCWDPVRPNQGAELLDENILSSGTEVVDSSFALYVIVKGTEPIYYHWLKDGEDLINVIKDTLKFSSLDTSDNGVYRCIISNNWGNDTTNEYILKAVFPLGPPVITSPDKNIETSPLVAELDSVFTMYIVARGTDSMEYIWYFNGDSIPGKNGIT